MIGMVAFGWVSAVIADVPAVCFLLGGAVLWGCLVLGMGLFVSELLAG